MKLFLIMLMMVNSSAYACNYNKKAIDTMVKRGEVVIKLDKEGHLDEVACDTAKLGADACRKKIEMILDYYHKHEKHGGA